MAPTNYYLVLAAILFTIGTIGVLIRRNVLVIFMCIEMMMNAVNLSFLALANQFKAVDGQIFVFIVMAVAAVEVGVGLAIVIALQRNRNTTNINEVNLLKG